MTLDPPPHVVGVIHISLPESRLEMPFLPLNGELLHREGSEDGKQQKLPETRPDAVRRSGTPAL
jgi:hypothetical protein